jgi:starch synthase
MDVMNGEIVLRNENHGYWHTNTMVDYANPFFVKMCKKLWEKFPNFMIIGECWGGRGIENRQIILTRSGVIPRMFKLPQAISSIFGKTL